MTIRFCQTCKHDELLHKNGHWCQHKTEIKRGHPKKILCECIEFVGEE